MSSAYIHVSCNAHTLAAEAYEIEQQQDSFEIIRRWSTINSVCVPHILISLAASGV